MPVMFYVIDFSAYHSRPNNRSKSGSGSTKSAVSRQPTSATLQEKENKITNLSLCPVVLRKQVPA